MDQLEIIPKGVNSILQDGKRKGDEGKGGKKGRVMGYKKKKGRREIEEPGLLYASLKEQVIGDKKRKLNRIQVDQILSYFLGDNTFGSNLRVKSYCTPN